MQLFKEVLPIGLVFNAWFSWLKLSLWLTYNNFRSEKLCNVSPKFKYNGNQGDSFLFISSKVPITTLSPYEYSLFQIQRFVDKEKVGSFPTSV
ncbi:hypothetical protein ACE1B6_15040 [Aerosakkonemataceae cyanobacterium BLCC-F154]|uniref:Uncharacterized protein n=1 Tax=Floridaenema fluviatile BLCC-F154 TaxID=3153640 RepID=A0ABV4YCL7_9CYAN